MNDVDAALAIADTVDNDAYHSRDRALSDIAGIEFTHWSLGPAWRQAAARFDEDQLRAAASAYLAARLVPLEKSPLK